MKKLLVIPEGTFELELTAQEIAQREQDAIKAEQDRIAFEAEKQAKIVAKASALAKLSALGLNDAEINSILGK